MSSEIEVVDEVESRDHGSAASASASVSDSAAGGGGAEPMGLGKIAYETTCTLRRRTEIWRSYRDWWSTRVARFPNPIPLATSLFNGLPSIIARTAAAHLAADVNSSVGGFLIGKPHGGDVNAVDHTGANRKLTLECGSWCNPSFRGITPRGNATGECHWI
uniref:Uncharacterized protein n=1 Tax=Fagus sylvatica TaxID=28930 RepID=A0A2N9J863_FAGSY